MARVELAPEVLDDFDRFFDHMQAHGIDDAPERISQIVQALQLLTHSPLIGRKVSRGMRELVVGHDARGYVALCRYVSTLDIAFVLAVRSQREQGYAR